MVKIRNIINTDGSQKFTVRSRLGTVHSMQSAVGSLKTENLRTSEQEQNIKKLYFTFFNDLRYPSLPERLLPRRSLKQLPTLTEVDERFLVMALH